MSITLDLRPYEATATVRVDLPRLTPDEFYELCRRNETLFLERSASGEVIVVPPSGSETSSRKSHIVTDLTIWARQDGTGVVFDSSAGFVLPNGAIRSLDASWMRRERWEALTETERERFAPLCPDFVVELLSPSDRLSDAHAKMEEYMANGAALGWLIDRRNRQVSVYRPGQPVVILSDPQQVSGDPEMPGFSLDMQRIF